MNTKKQLKKANKLNQELQNQINQLKDEIYELKPSVFINFQREKSFSFYFEGTENKFFGIDDNMPDTKKTEQINKRIAETIDKYGIIKFNGKSLYDFRSLGSLKDAITLIENEVYEYYTSEYENASKVEYDSEGIWLKDRLITREEINVAINKEALEAKARQKAGTQEEFNDLLHTFSYYLEKKYFYKKLTLNIDDCINKFNIDKYLNTSLYDITKAEKYEEALRAIPKMHQLKNVYGVTAYKGTPIEDLSEYELDGIILNCKKKDFSECTLIEKPKSAKITATRKKKQAA